MRGGRSSISRRRRSARKSAGASPKRITTTSGAPRSSRKRPRRRTRKRPEKELAAIRQRLGLPEENLLYFLEKRAPRLKPWQRELVRIARHVSQYFYPQKQTKMMNEGCATFCHYEIVHRLHEKGLISDGTLLEIMHSHTSVVTQPEFDDQRYSGINPYALGFAMMRDIKRICLDPSAEDREWFPDFAGNGDPYGTLRHAWANYRDESFVLQYLSPRLMREFRLFKLVDDADQDAMVVDAIHEDRGYREIRRALARQYDLARHEPDIQVRDVDLAGDRCLVLSHAVHDGVLLDENSARAVLEQLSGLWHYGIRLEETDATSDKVLKTHEVSGAPLKPHGRNQAPQCRLNETCACRMRGGPISAACATFTECSLPSMFFSQKARKRCNSG